MKGILNLFVGCALLTFASCEKENISIFKLNSYYWYYTETIGLTTVPEDEDGLVKLEYSGNRVVKRVGGMEPLPIASGYRNKFTKDVYETVKYEGNVTIVTRKHIQEGWEDREWKVLFDEQGRMIEKIEISPYNPLSNDTTKYIYASGRLKSSQIGNDKSKYYFNSSGNIDSIVVGFASPDIDFAKNKIIVFEDYDTSPNPFNALSIFDDTFFRSLSNNNYRSRKIRDYGSDDYYDTRSWDIKYNNNGYPIFDE